VDQFRSVDVDQFHSDRNIGREGILAQSHRAAPTSREPRFGVSPRIACKDPARRAARLRFYELWLEEYARCLESWRAGNRDVVFPYGTNKMRRCHGVRVAPAPSAAAAPAPV